MLRRRGTYIVNAEPDDRHSRPKSTEPSSFVIKKSGKTSILSFVFTHYISIVLEMLSEKYYLIYMYYSLIYYTCYWKRSA